jgi:hypothetical protein
MVTASLAVGRGTLRMTPAMVGGSLVVKTLFWAPGVPSVPTTDAAQFPGAALSKRGFRSSREGPVPSAAGGHGGESV